MREAPTPPDDWFNEEARAEWHRVVPGLERLDILTSEDRTMLVVRCTTWSRYAEGPWHASAPRG